MNFPLLDIGCFFEQKGSEFLVENNQTQSHLQAIEIFLDNPQNINNVLTADKTKVYKTDQNRRARNVISSRIYRAKKRKQLQQLEIDNKALQESIDEAEKVLNRLNQAFRMFIQHAETCDKCCQIQLHFE